MFWRSCCDNTNERDYSIKRFNRVVPSHVKEVIGDIVKNVETYKKKKKLFDEWCRLGSELGVDVSLMFKARGAVLDGYRDEVNKGMAKLARFAGAESGLTNLYWYSIDKGEYTYTFVDQDDRFCFDKRRVSPFNGASYVADYGCADDIELRDALVILYNLARGDW